MWGEKKKWIRILDRLWLKNHHVSQFYRRATGVATEAHLKRSLVKYASKRAQFAFELSQQISRLGGKPPVYETFSGGEATISLSFSEENKERILRKSIEIEKESLELYSHSLSIVNDGGIREILLRHRAAVTIVVRELQKLNALPPLEEDEDKLTNKNQQS